MELRLKVRKASLGSGFNVAGATADTEGEAALEIPVKIEIADREFGLAIFSEFDFRKEGTKAKGTGASAFD